MTVFITIIIFVAMLAVLILAHELGHLISAKLSGVKVLEFGLGFPPKIWGFEYKGTIYSINVVPLGGFTKMLGEEDPTALGSLASKSHIKRFIVLVAGSAMNLLLPILLFSIAFMIPHDMISEKVQVDGVEPGTPAMIAGIEPGDIILEVDGREVQSRRDVGFIIQLNRGKEVDLLLQKPDMSEEKVSATARWKYPEDQGPTGIRIVGVDTTTVRESQPFWVAIPKSIRHCWEILVLFKNEIVSWFARGSVPQLTGPIGVAQVTGEMARAGVSPLLEFAAFISINLGLVNLLPIPGLDGGRIIFVGLEWVRRGRRISPRKEGLIHLTGFFVLIALILLITYNDIARIIRGDTLVP